MPLAADVTNLTDFAIAIATLMVIAITACSGATACTVAEEKPYIRRCKSRFQSARAELVGTILESNVLECTARAAISSCLDGHPLADAGAASCMHTCTASCGKPPPTSAHSYKRVPARAVARWHSTRALQDDGYVAKILVAGGTKDIEVGTTVAIMVEDKDDVRYPPPPSFPPSHRYPLARAQ